MSDNDGRNIALNDQVVIAGQTYYVSSVHYDGQFATLDLICVDPFAKRRAAS